MSGQTFAISILLFRRHPEPCGLLLRVDRSHQLWSATRQAARGTDARQDRDLAPDQSADESLVSRIFASWNQVAGWLRQIEGFRAAA
jgi:hypothetical protein